MMKGVARETMIVKARTTMESLRDAEREPTIRSRGQCDQLTIVKRKAAIRSLSYVYMGTKREGRELTMRSTRGVFFNPRLLLHVYAIDSELQHASTAHVSVGSSPIVIVTTIDEITFATST